MSESLEKRIAIMLVAATLFFLILPMAIAEDASSPLGDQAEDVGDSFQQTQDGGFIVVATKEASVPEGNDVWLIKADAEGNETWRKAFSFGPGEDGGASVQQTRDGGYIVAGYTDSTGDTYDILLMKTDASGDEQWCKTFSLGEGNDIGSDVREADDGGFIIAGFTNSTGADSYDVLLLKVDADGEEQWQKTFSMGDENDIGGDVVDTEDGYVIAGLTTSDEGSGVLLIKTDLEGEELWRKAFVGVE